MPTRRADQAFQPDEGAAADKQNVGGVDRGEFLVRMLASPLGRYIGYRALQDLQQGLLHALAGDIASNGRVFVLAADFIDFINIDDAGLRSGYVAIGSLKQLEDDIFDVFAHIAGLRQRGGVYDRERYIQHLGQGMRQQGLATSGRTDQQNVGLGQLDVIAACPVHLDTLVVVVDRYSQLLFGLLLADDVLIEKSLHLLRFGQVSRRCPRLRSPPGHLPEWSCRPQRIHHRCGRADNRSVSEINLATASCDL